MLTAATLRASGAPLVPDDYLEEPVGGECDIGIGIGSSYDHRR
jgi:hypothetical protein